MSRPTGLNCVLCRERFHGYEKRRQPAAGKVSGFGICTAHLKILRAIAKANGTVLVAQPVYPRRHAEPIKVQSACRDDVRSA